MRGGGVEVSVNLTGWTQSGGPEVLHESYVRLGTFDTPKAHTRASCGFASKGTDLSSLCERITQGHKGGKIVEPTAFAGKAGCLVSASPSATLSDLFFETLVEDHWLEWHYSALRDDQFVESGRRALEPLVASLSAKVETVPTAVPQSDLTDRQLEFIQKTQECNADSKDLICRALAAFKTGRRPSGRPQPVGIIGITFPLGSDESLVGYLVLSDTAVRQDTVILQGKKEEAAGTELVASLKAGKQPPENNVLMAMARSQPRCPTRVDGRAFHAGSVGRTRQDVSARNKRRTRLRQYRVRGRISRNRGRSLSYEVAVELTDSTLRAPRKLRVSVTIFTFSPCLIKSGTRILSPMSAGWPSWCHSRWTYHHVLRVPPR